MARPIALTDDAERILHFALERALVMIRHHQHEDAVRVLAVATDAADLVDQQATDK